MTKADVIKIEIPQTLKNEFLARIERKYGDAKTRTVSNVILNIFEEWLLKEDELRPILDEEPYDEPAADAVALPEEQKDFFENATPGVEAGILDPDYEINWLHWNGNVLENVIKARAQVMHILAPKEYPALGRKVFENILSAVEHSKGVI